MVAGQSLVKFLDKFELIRNSWGGDVEGVKQKYASTRTASGASGETDRWVPRVRRETGCVRLERGGDSPELTPATRGFGARLEG